MSVFVKWWIEFWLIVVGSFFAVREGYLDLVFANDITHLSYVIVGVFVAYTALLGFETARKRVNKSLIEWGWFLSEMSLALGMLGTVIGFIYMLSGSMGGMSADDPETIKQALGVMALGMSTALYTTAIGLVSSVLIKVQLITLVNDDED